MENCKEKFKDFIIHNHISAATNNGLSGQSPDKYISNLNTLNEKISVMTVEKNFFDYDEKEFPYLIQQIRNAPDYKDVNKTSGRTISAALNVFEKFIEYLKISTETFLSIKISNPDYVKTVEAIQEKGQNIEISQLNQLKEKIGVGQLVFMVPFGDKVPWEKGLTGIAKVSELPYDDKDKNFKIKVSMFCSFKTISRAEFIPYPGTYDAADIGPSTKGSQNQAIKQISVEQAASIIRAILELRPETKEDIFNNVDNRLLEISMGQQMILRSVYSSYNTHSSSPATGENVIYYGVPGCGKSYKVEHEILEAKGVLKEDVFRTTFYLDYSNTDFVGQIYPTIDGDNVEYKQIAGPFTKALERALRYKGKNIYLVIEEINRGNAAAIFGDLFQLLDRLKVNSIDGRVSGDSEYPITNEFIEGYFEKRNQELKDQGETTLIKFQKGKLYIPHNLTIYATMNTSDQNVFPLDTAFKRRWQRERVLSKWDKENNDRKNLLVPGTDITWEMFAKGINEIILKNSKDGSISEDKCLGSFFATKNMLLEGNESMPQKEKKLEAFVNNVIDYLYNDVTKFDHKILFNSDISSFENMYKKIVDRKIDNFKIDEWFNQDTIEEINNVIPE